VIKWSTNETMQEYYILMVINHSTCDFSKNYKTMQYVRMCFVHLSHGINYIPTKKLENTILLFYPIVLSHGFQITLWTSHSIIYFISLMKHYNLT